MPEGLVLQASLSCPLVQLEGFSIESEAFFLYYEKSSVIIVEYRFDCELFRLIAPSS